MNINDEKTKSTEITVEREQLFILRSPKTGKIYRGPHYRAFNKQSLGSIPRNNEKIIFVDKSNQNIYGFSSLTERFTEKTESEKYSFPGPGEYSTKITNSIEAMKINPSFSSKGYGNGFLSKFDRFDNIKEFYDKYSPGPGNYNDEKKTVSDEVKNSGLYKNLFNLEKEFSPKIPIISPGPGYYNPNNPLIDKKIDKESYIFLSKDKRTPFEIKSFSPGPQRYNMNNIKEFNILKDPIKTQFFFMKNSDKKDFVVENIIYSPMIEKLKNEKEVKDFMNLKFLKNKLDKKFYSSLSPGPGEYNNESLIGKLKYDYNFMNKNIKNSKEFEKEKEKEREIEEINILKNIRKEAFIPYIPPYENLKNSANYIFSSKTQKNIEVPISGIPGPSYYNPVVQSKKLSYNTNSEKIWV